MTARKNGTVVAAAASGIVLDRAALLGAKLRIEDVPVPELGGVVRVRELSAADLFSLPPDTIRNNALLIARSVVDASGARAFQDDDADALMATLSATTASILLQTITEINFRTKAASADLAKN